VSVNCPYSILTQFDHWFHWHKCVIVDGYSPEGATQDTQFIMNGWTRFAHGGWVENATKFIAHAVVIKVTPVWEMEDKKRR